MAEIRIWNRTLQREEQEKVYGDGLVKFLYQNSGGQFLAEHFLTGPSVSRFYGYYQSSKLSRHKITSFVREFQIPMKEYEDVHYSSFNDFFIRRFKTGERNFIGEPAKMPAFAEARYLGWEKVTDSQVFPVKGKFLSAEAILGRAMSEFRGGPLLIARLCPVDYHRFHFPDDGEILESFRVAGKLHSVNPLALRFRGDIFATNERQVSILETRAFGKLAYVEVGALCVGKICQTHADRTFTRGQEKGYFLFGGSTVIVLGQAGRWKPTADILENTAVQREVLVQLGQPVAEKAQ